MRSYAIRFGAVSVVAAAALWGGSGGASAGGGCHSAPTAVRGDTVEVADLCFVSTVLYVKPGTEVTWTNRDPIAHDVVGVGDTWGDPGRTLFRGDHLSYRFDEEGVFPYACWIHPGMVGAIVVGDGVGSVAAGVVPGTGAAVAEPTSTEAVATGVAGGARPAVVTWITGAALVLACVAGGFAIAARERRKSAALG